MALNIEQKPRPIRAYFPTKISNMSVNAVARGRAIKSGSKYQLSKLKLHVVGLDLEYKLLPILVSKKPVA